MVNAVLIYLSLVALAQKEFYAVIPLKERIQMLLSIVPIIGANVVLISYVVLCKS